MLKKFNFRIFSDLHLEFDKNNVIINKCKKISENNPVDYLLLAGDIVNYKTKTKLFELINDIKPHYKQIFYILGNHEYYFNNITEDIKNQNKTTKYILDDYKNICDNLGIKLLEDEFYKFENTNIILYGTTMWSKNSDMSIKYINDKLFVNKTEIDNKYDESRKKLEYFLNDDNNKDKNIIVMTHHMPSYKFISKKYYEDDPKNGLNAAFASDLEYLFTPNISYWIFGHTHDKISTIYENITFHANPHGYLGEKKDEYKDVIITLTSP